MENLKNSQRRRAAVAVLGDLLEEADLLQALWVQHETMRGESVTDLIAFVDGVATRHGLDAATRKRLYTEYFQAMRMDVNALPLDPWPAMQALRTPTRSVAPRPTAPMPTPTPTPMPMPMPAPTPAATPVVAAAGGVAQAPSTAPQLDPVAAALAAAATRQAFVPAPPLRPAPAAPDSPSLVFGAVMRALLEEVRRFHAEALDEVRKDALAVLDSSQASAAARDAFRKAWSRALQDDWQLAGTHTDLSELVRVINYALSEAFGRTGAEQILQRALQGAEQLDEAQTFAPRRLLASL